MTSEVSIKTNTKTKGTPQDFTDDLTPNEPETEKVVNSPITLTSKRALMTFRAMFPFTQQELKTEVDWNTFVDSMHDAGFVAKSSGGGGSSVKFKVRDGEGSINFHRPHLDPTIDPIMLQAIGWRMNK